MSKTVFITLLSSKKKKLKKKIELKSKKEKIVIENLRKKNCNRASPPRNTQKNIPGVATKGDTHSFNETYIFLSFLLFIIYIFKHIKKNSPHNSNSLKYDPPNLLFYEHPNIVLNR